MSQASDRLPVSRSERLRKIRRSHRGTLGIAEIIGLGIAALTLLAVIVGYLHFQGPGQHIVAAPATDRDPFQQPLPAAQEETKRGNDDKAPVHQITVSLV